LNEVFLNLTGKALRD